MPDLDILSLIFGSLIRADRKIGDVIIAESLNVSALDRNFSDDPLSSLKVYNKD